MAGGRSRLAQRVGPQVGDLSVGARAGAEVVGRQRTELPAHAPSDEQALSVWLAEALNDPVLFAERVLGQTLADWQKAYMRVLLEQPMVAIAGGHSSGKTHTVLCYFLWSMAAKERFAFFQTSPTRDSGETVFWQNVRGVYEGSALCRSLMDNRPIRKNSLRIDEYRYAEMVSSGSAVNIQGRHAEELVFFCDEATGIEGDLWNAIYGITASGRSKIFQLGNPTVSSGTFWDAFHDPESSWYTMHASSLMSPNISGLELPRGWSRPAKVQGVSDEEMLLKLGWLAHCWRQLSKWRREKEDVDWVQSQSEWQTIYEMKSPHFASREFVGRAVVEWGERQNPNWQSRVLGQFAQQGTEQVFAPESVRRAEPDAAWYPAEADSCVAVWGLDPASSTYGTGEWVLVGALYNPRRQEYQVIHDEGYYGYEALGDIQNVLLNWHIQTQGGWVNVDRVGVGDRPYEELARWGAYYGLQVLGFNSQERPMAAHDSDTYADMKTQAYHYLRSLFLREEIHGVSNPKTAMQLQGIRRDEGNQSRGKLRMERKRDMFKRGVESPDHADAMVYCVFPLTLMVPRVQSFNGQEPDDWSRMIW